jgi:anti-sigma factor RsiW
MLNERDEFLISQLADGSIGPADRLRAEQLVASNDDARRCFESYRRLDAMLDVPAPSAAIALRIVGELNRLDSASLTEADEMLIAEYAQGTLESAGRARAEALLASNPKARLCLSDELSLDRALGAIPEPSAGLDLRVIEALDEHDNAQQRSRMRIGRWLRPAITVAAMLVVGGVVALVSWIPTTSNLPPLVLASAVPDDDDGSGEVSVTLVDRPIDPKMFVEHVPSGVIDLQPVVFQASLEGLSRW